MEVTPQYTIFRSDFIPDKKHDDLYLYGVVIPNVSLLVNGFVNATIQFVVVEKSSLLLPNKYIIFTDKSTTDAAAIYVP